jgi:hypothetical protein
MQSVILIARLIVRGVASLAEYMKSSWEIVFYAHIDNKPASAIACRDVLNLLF